MFEICNHITEESNITIESPLWLLYVSSSKILVNMEKYLDYDKCADI